MVLKLLSIRMRISVTVGKTEAIRVGLRALSELLSSTSYL